jgi:hypothetical protein
MTNIDPNLVYLEKSIDSNDGDYVEDVLNGAFKSGLSPDLVPALIRLLSLKWHQRHEDVVGALQELKDPKSVEALFQAATSKHEYLSFDEFDGLARKCTWALADIGTEEAKSKLAILSKSDNPRIAGYAKKRLDNWESEMHRKGNGIK